MVATHIPLVASRVDQLTLRRSSSGHRLFSPFSVARKSRRPGLKFVDALRGVRFRQGIVECFPGLAAQCLQVGPLRVRHGLVTGFPFVGIALERWLIRIALVPHEATRSQNTRQYCREAAIRHVTLRVCDPDPSSAAANDRCTPEALSLPVRFSRSSRGRLTDRDIGRFAGETLLDRVGRAVCHAGCLPRKELYEAWETARRVRRLFRGGRVVDLAAGHGLLAQLMLILDDTSPCALAVDAVAPPSSAALNRALVENWPRLAGRLTFLATPIDVVEILPGDIVVSIHACGGLTDRVLEIAATARARVAVLPCCHDVSISDGGALSGWMNDALAIDVVRARRLADQGYRIWTQRIPPDITPQNRLLIGAPANVPASS